MLFWPNVKNLPTAKGQSLPQELEVGPHSRLFPLALLTGGLEELTEKKKQIYWPGIVGFFFSNEEGEILVFNMFFFFFLFYLGCYCDTVEHKKLLK